MLFTDHITPTDMVYTGIMFYEDFKNLVTFAATKTLDVLVTVYSVDII
jgi:hypothetical protein